MKYGYADYGQSHLLPLESEIVDGTGFWSGPGHKVFLGRSCCGSHETKEDARLAYIEYLNSSREELRARVNTVNDKINSIIASLP